jgi:signal transduction histidine kinase
VGARRHAKSIVETNQQLKSGSGFVRCKFQATRRNFVLTADPLHLTALVDWSVVVVSHRRRRRQTAFSPESSARRVGIHTIIKRSSPPESPAQEVEERLKLALATADVGTWDLDVFANTLRRCSRCAAIFGSQIDTKNWYQEFLERVHPDDRDIVAACVQSALDPVGRGQYDQEYRIVLRSGELRWIAAKGKVFFEEIDGQLWATRFMGTLLDRTEFRRAQEALLQSERLAITGRLAASIAHEIQNPLESLTNLLYLLRDEKSLEQRAEYLAMAETEIAHLSEISLSTLEFCRDPVGIAPVDIAALVDSIVVVFRGRITGLQVCVQRELDPGVAVLAPQGELRQVLVNLISNALDAMPKGGRLILRARELTGRTGEKCVRLSIADTGFGMAPDVVVRVFEAFYTTKGVSGTGIGLWLSQEIIKKCGSRIHVKSSQGRGTVFSMYLSSGSKIV